MLRRLLTRLHARRAPVVHVHYYVAKRDDVPALTRQIRDEMVRQSRRAGRSIF